MQWVINNPCPVSCRSGKWLIFNSPWLMHCHLFTPALGIVLLSAWTVGIYANVHARKRFLCTQFSSKSLNFMKIWKKAVTSLEKQNEHVGLFSLKNNITQFTNSFVYCMWFLVNESKQLPTEGGIREFR